MEKLKIIFQELSSIADGMTSGRISFSVDKVSSAMKCGHPGDMLSEMVGYFLFSFTPEDEVPADQLEIFLKDLKRFKRSFKVKELSVPIKALEEHLK